MTTEIEAEDLPMLVDQMIEDVVNGPYTSLLDDCRVIVLQGVRDNFTSSATPDNQNWPLRKVVGDGHPLLMDTGALMQAATGGGPGHLSETGFAYILGIGSHVLTVGVDGGAIPYAATHNFGRGGTRRRKLFGQTVRISYGIPQREFMGLRELRIDECEERIVGFVTGILNRS